MIIYPPKHLHQAYWDEEELHMKFAILYDHDKECIRRYRVLENDCGVEFIWRNRKPVLLSEASQDNLEFLGYGGRGQDEEQEWLIGLAEKQEGKQKEQGKKAIWTWGTDEAEAHSEELKLLADWELLDRWARWIDKHPELREKYPEETQFVINKYNNHPITLRNQEENKDGGGT